MVGLASTKRRQGRWGAVRMCSSNGVADVLSRSWLSNGLTLWSWNEMLVNNKINANWYWLLLTSREKQYIAASNCQMESSLTWYSVGFPAWCALILAAILSRSSGEWSCLTSQRFRHKETEPVSSDSESSSITSETSGTASSRWLTNFLLGIALIRPGYSSIKR